MPQTLIEQFPSFKKEIPQDNDYLNISEMFCNTLQGEGITAGRLSTFMRLQGCTLQCIWCDTLEVWKQGNPYSFDDIIKLFIKGELIHSFQNGTQRLIITGGSPLKQQSRIIAFLKYFENKFGFVPLIEIENECVLYPEQELIRYIYQWNNSPKLSNSGMKDKVRIKPDVLQKMNSLNNSWFKFVVTCEQDWQEIQRDFLPYISKDRIIVMPEGQTQQQLEQSRQIASDIAIKNQLIYSDRLHIVLWNQKVGV